MITPEMSPLYGSKKRAQKRRSAPIRLAQGGGRIGSDDSMRT
jgi:hypothetical protein